MKNAEKLIISEDTAVKVIFLGITQNKLDLHNSKNDLLRIQIIFKVINFVVMLLPNG